MFHRKRAASNPPRVVKTPPSQAASLAATQAFLANRASNGDLSAAAAAAALRSHTTSPAPVGQIQTKRMQRRGSVTSNGSAPDRPGLLRRTSSGSMTERTFRDPSPGRPASSHGPYTPQDMAPPVPAIPKNIPETPQSIVAQQRAARRAASVEPPERISSPPPRLNGGRGVSLDRGPGNYRLDEVVNKGRVTSLVNVGDSERPGSRNSVNFSRPISPQNSPLSPPVTGGRVRSPPPTKSTGAARLPEGEVDRILNSINEAGPAPVKKKKPRAVKGTKDGSQKTSESIGISAQIAPAQATPQQQPPSTSTIHSPDTVIMPSGVGQLPRPKKKKKKPSSAPPSQNEDFGEGFGSAYPSDTDSVTSELSSTNEKPRSYNTRAAGLLMKQPSIVREDREAEEQEENPLPKKKMNGQVAPDVTAGLATPTDTSKVASRGAQHTRAPSQTGAPQATQRASLDVPSASGHQSLSPVRSTHFSTQPQYETADGIKHEPPPRSVSPAKSALKHSPSRGQSPIGSLPATRRTGFAPSEASDTTSNVSDDGSRSAPRKKKSVRISFDEDSVTVGRAASPPMSPNSPVIVSPQNRPKGRSWLDLVREKKQEEAVVDADQDSVIKPTPALPSFGSVRRNRNEDKILDSTNGRKPSGDLAQDALRSIDTSSDQAVGTILSQDAKAKAQETNTQSTQPQHPGDSLPPEVTSVEGSGYHSDEAAGLLDGQQGDKAILVQDDIHQNSAVPNSAKDVLPAEPSSGDVQITEPNPAVPSIALQPATPGLDTKDQEHKGWLGMPGEFPDSQENRKSLPSCPVSGSDQNSSEISPATMGLAEPEPVDVAARHDPASPNVGEVADGLRTQMESHSGDESDDTGASIYSDAAEDPDDLAGDGFGSINAIVESPVPSPVVAVASRSPPASPSMKTTVAKTGEPSPLARNESELSEPASEEGWDRAQAYWSGLSQEKRRQLENAAIPGALDERVTPEKTVRGPNSVKKKDKKVSKKPTSPVGTNDSQTFSGPDKSYGNDIMKPSQPAAPPLKSSARRPQATYAQDSRLRSSMRNSRASGDGQEPHIRSSMRDRPPLKSALRNGSDRKSLQIPTSEPRGTIQKNRPTSAVAVVDYNKPQATPATGHIRASSAGMPSTSSTLVLAQPKKKAPVKKAMLYRNDSDSSSSFKKERLTSPTAGKYTMKRTMRPSSVEPQRPSDRASSLSARTASPAGSTARRPFSTVGPGNGGMRTSMRDSAGPSQPAARTSLRESMDSKRTKSPTRFGFGKSSKAKPATAKPASRFSSRFGDSSDEEDSRPTRSRRFADSSDDEPTRLAPVRGIPRRIDEGDSTDLEDSSVENTPTPSKIKINGTKPALDTKLEGVALATGSLRVAFGDGPTTALGTGLQAKKAAEEHKKKRSFFGSLGNKKRDDPSRVRKADIESAARRDTPLERSKTERLLTTGFPKDGRVLGPSSPTADPVAQVVRPAINPRTSSAQNSPKSPKLQRRNTPKQAATAKDISWPLSQKPSETPGSRPRTSDGAAVGNGAGRPDIGARRTTVHGPSQPSTPPLAVGKPEKKKRFGMLRKAFGMQN